MGRLAFAVVPRWILGTLMLIGVAINFANVLSRYLLGHAMFWVEEVLVFLTIWGVFIGMAAIAYDGAHLNMDLFCATIRGRLRTFLNGAIVLLFLACSAFVVVQSWKVVALFVQSGQVSVSAGVPKAIPHAALLVGFALTLLAVLVRVRSYLSGKF
jgi:TRAP-type C4-dicarboxylate transport system permease small subunit